MVVYRSAPSAGHARRATDRGARTRHVLPEARIAAMEVEGRELQELAGDPDVEAIVPDRVVTSTAAAYSIPVQTAGAPTAWTSGYTGSGVGIAVIDSGIVDHQDFSAASSTAKASSTTGPTAIGRRPTCTAMGRTSPARFSAAARPRRRRPPTWICAPSPRAPG